MQVSEDFVYVGVCAQFLAEVRRWRGTAGADLLLHEFWSHGCRKQPWFHPCLTESRSWVHRERRGPGAAVSSREVGQECFYVPRFHI